jgi:hypothetical protein
MYSRWRTVDSAFRTCRHAGIPYMDGAPAPQYPSVVKQVMKQPNAYPSLVKQVMKQPNAELAGTIGDDRW